MDDPKRLLQGSCSKIKKCYFSFPKSFEKVLIKQTRTAKIPVSRTHKSLKISKSEKPTKLVKGFQKCNVVSTFLSGKFARSRLNVLFWPLINFDLTLSNFLAQYFYFTMNECHFHLKKYICTTFLYIYVICILDPLRNSRTKNAYL